MWSILRCNSWCSPLGPEFHCQTVSTPGDVCRAGVDAGEITPRLDKAPSHWYLSVCWDSAFPGKKPSSLLKPWRHCSQMAKSSLIAMNPWFHLPVFLNWVTVCHTENFTQNIHPGLPFFKISLAIMDVHCLLWHFFWQWISVDYDSWHAEVGDLFLTNLKTNFCFKIWKKSQWNSPVTVRPAVVLPLETLRGPELSSPQTWHTPAFVLQKATSSVGLTFWYVCQIFLQIY